ncbi:eukaryotic translation initiation factor 4E type 1B [Leptonychotes weddellii]|uniref:Eukaryotic translation initiation factor 4E type 1B n=1 Tax=Leptonychotes weddellii TaxID=9713 RepID=A0A2U3XP24_LEPWE|nr:eukaryotic translation initiation factor 4E type 1B [Leptonychotes weddellii]
MPGMYLELRASHPHYCRVENTQVRDAEGGIRKLGEKEEKKEEKEGAAGPVLMAEGALNPPGALLSQRRKAQEGGPQGVKLELHPLLNRWALWFFKNDRSRAWQDNLHLVTKFDTVEDFWAMYSHIQLASKLSSGCDYALFKDGIEPMWEDSRNKRGGRWLVSLAKQQRHSELDRLWLETVYKERLGLSTKIVIGYQAHADTATKSNSLAKNKFVV